MARVSKDSLQELPKTKTCDCLYWDVFIQGDQVVTETFSQVHL